MACTFTTPAGSERAAFADPTLGRFAQADTIVPGAGNPAAWDRYAAMMNNPVKYTDPSGHDPTCTLLLDDQCAKWSDNRQAGGVKPKPQPPANPLGEHLSDQDLQVLAVLMYYEYRGYSQMTADIWEIVKMKFWVFMNLINARRYEITHGWGIYNSSGSKIGEWNPYTAVAGHESPLKPVLADELEGWTPDNYYGQYAALLGKARDLMGGGDPTEADKIYMGMFTAAKEVEAMWYQYGSGSAADPTGGRVGFWDTDAPIEGYLSVGPFLFNLPDIYKYSVFHW